MTKTRKDNVEYHNGKNAFLSGLKQSDNPYLNTEETRNNPDSRWNRWDAGYRDACDKFIMGKS